MKNGMKKQKDSTFLREIARSHGKAYSGHSGMRSAQRNTNVFPNSVKVGAGDITARRSLPNQVLHKRNHRETGKNSVMRGYKYDRF